jgi:tetratricopeptide (TPR) repeat protein
MEDFLEEADDASLVRVQRVRRSIRETGKMLFESVFQANAETKAIWRTIKQRLGQTRTEILESSESSSPTWELMRDPVTDVPLSLSAVAFVRSDSSHSSYTGIPVQPQVKMLLVISRPGGTDDVGFRTIATTLFDGLKSNPQISVDVLRPPSFENLARVLRDASAGGTRYDLVHFDGHGFYSSAASTGAVSGDIGGQLIFEHDSSDESQSVSGREFAALMSECGVKAVVLNACRSAHEELSDPDSSPLSRPPASFSRSLLLAGIPAVIAMNYNVYVASAKRFMEEFYRQLGRGVPFSVAGSLARKHLATDRRRFQQDSSEIDDWLVPAIYQSGEDLRIEPSGEAPVPRASAVLPASFPPPPELGFVGSDDALLQIDRSFDSHNIALLYGVAGAGKTAASVEFASWFQATNPEIRTLLFTSFESGPSLSDVLAGAEPEIGFSVSSVDLGNSATQRTILQKLVSKGSLWVWDNVETIDELDEAAQSEFRSFLRWANEGGLKILLTARGRQTEWLGDLASLIEMPRLRDSESIELAKRLLSLRGLRRFDLTTLLPILEFAGGNPLTLIVALSSYLTSSRRPSRDEVLRYVESLERGARSLDDPGGIDRARSLVASLSYGFEKTFTAREARILSLLSLFRVYINSFMLAVMCRPGVDPRAAGLPDHDFSWTIPEFAEETVESLERLLDKATSVGLLRKTGDLNFWLHPAVHLYLTHHFDEAYANPGERQSAQRAYAEAEGLFAIQFTRLFQAGGRAPVIGALTKEQENLNHALHLSHTNGWWQAEIGILHGLNALLWHQGRNSEWRILFLSVWNDFVDPELRPLPGREQWWSFIVDHRLRIAMEDKDLDIAERLARLLLNHEQAETEAISRQPGSTHNDPERKKLQLLAIATGRLADVLRIKGDSECIDLNEDAVRIYELIDDRPGIAIRFLNLGHSFKNVPAVRNLERAAESYTKALDFYHEQDALARAQCLAQLALVSMERFRERSSENAPTRELLRLLNHAAETYETALEMLPPEAFGNLATLHNQLGTALRFDPSRQERALHHLRLACQYYAAIGQYFECATSRANMAQILAMMGRHEEAAAAASQALSEFEALGHVAESTPQLERIVRRGRRSS